MTVPWKSLLASGSRVSEPFYHEHPRLEILPFVDWTPRVVLDVGCGGGTTGRILAEQFSGCRLYGIEPNKEAAEAARPAYRHVWNGTVESAVLSESGIPFAEVDTVLLLDVLEHLYNPWRMLLALRERLPQGCRVVASIPNAFNVQLIEELASGEWRYDACGLLDITHIRFFTEAGMRELFEQAGVGVDSVGSIPHPQAMLPDPIHFRDGAVETAHAIVKGVDSEARRDLLTIQKIIVGTCGAPSHRVTKSSRRGYDPDAIKPVTGLGRTYLDLIRNCVLGLIHEDPGIVAGRVGTVPFSAAHRENGLDWPSVAHSMIGTKRMLNLQTLAEHVLVHGVPGDFIETGVWRGGACIMMRAVLEAYGVRDRRVWVADSFQGLPRPDPAVYPADAGDTHFSFDELAVSVDEVRRNFARYGLLDDQVVFLEGWFRDTLPSAPVEKLAVMRLDGDMYESTMDALTSLYPKLSRGGFVIVDDYGYLESCRRAVHDHRNTNGIVDPIHDIDGMGVFWQNLLPNRFS